jgi:hypothetical protein
MLKSPGEIGLAPEPLISCAMVDKTLVSTDIGVLHEV